MPYASRTHEPHISPHPPRAPGSMATPYLSLQPFRPSWLVGAPLTLSWPLPQGLGVSEGHLGKRSVQAPEPAVGLEGSGPLCGQGAASVPPRARTWLGWPGCWVPAWACVDPDQQA